MGIVGDHHAADGPTYERPAVGGVGRSQDVDIGASIVSTATSGSAVTVSCKGDGIGGGGGGGEVGNNLMVVGDGEGVGAGEGSAVEGHSGEGVALVGRGGDGNRVAVEEVFAATGGVSQGHGAVCSHIGVGVDSAALDKGGRNLMSASSNIEVKLSATLDTV